MTMFAEIMDQPAAIHLIAAAVVLCVGLIVVFVAIFEIRRIDSATTPKALFSGLWGEVYAEEARLGSVGFGKVYSRDWFRRPLAKTSSGKNAGRGMAAKKQTRV